MTKTKIAFIAAAGLIGLTAVGGAAWAKRMGHHGGGVHLMNLTERYDANKDGAVTQEEIDTNRTEWHGKFDADKNGALSLDEFKALWLEAQKERVVRDFQDFDRDGDAKLTLDEYKKPLASVVADMDRNGDSKLSPDDRRMRHRGHGEDGGKGQN